MKTKAVRLYGVGDLRLEEFELPPITESEILAHVISDSICMSTYKAASQGSWAGGCYQVSLTVSTQRVRRCGGICRRSVWPS